MIIDFPSSPSEGYIVAGGSKVRRYINETWVLVKHQAGDGGVI